MNKLFLNENVEEFAKQNNISKNTLDRYKQEVEKSINENNTFDESVLRTNFNRYCWKIIEKANQILVNKLDDLSQRESHIDELLNKIEICLGEEVYDKTQMGKLIKTLESMKSNNLSELARIIQIMYDRTEEVTSKDETKSLEDYINDFSGDIF